jgi:hypothetical protein
MYERTEHAEQYQKEKKETKNEYNDIRLKKM